MCKMFIATKRSGAHYFFIGASDPVLAIINNYCDAINEETL